ncbi:MAG TPA: hypothetical protein VIL84_11655 [Devosiaceae bacterium]
MKTIFVTAAAAAALLGAAAITTIPALAASPSVEQCSNGLFNKNHPDLCKGISPSDAYGQNDGDTAGPGSRPVV